RSRHTRSKRDWSSDVCSSDLAVIVVEGKDDTIRLKQFFPGIETIETNGSAVSDEVLKQIQKLSESRQIIVFTDPDFNGERIRRIVTKAVPDAKQAFIDRKSVV